MTPEEKRESRRNRRAQLGQDLSATLEAKEAKCRSVVFRLALERTRAQLQSAVLQLYSLHS